MDPLDPLGIVTLGSEYQNFVQCFVAGLSPASSNTAFVHFVQYCIKSQPLSASNYYLTHCVILSQPSSVEVETNIEHCSYND